MCFIPLLLNWCSFRSEWREMCGHLTGNPAKSILSNFFSLYLLNFAPGAHQSEVLRPAALTSLGLLVEIQGRRPSGLFQAPSDSYTGTWRISGSVHKASLGPLLLALLLLPAWLPVPCPLGSLLQPEALVHWFPPCMLESAFQADPAWAIASLFGAEP